MNVAPTGSPPGCHQPNSAPPEAAALTLRSSVTVRNTVFLAGSARRKSPAAFKNRLVSAVMNQLIGPCFHPGRVGTDDAKRTSGGRRGARRGSVQDPDRGRRGYGLLPGQRGQRAPDRVVRRARPDGG